MTYKDIVNRIQDVVNQHYMLQDFGYGDLSDLKTRFENSSGDTQNQANYPYLFLNPATHTRTGAAVTYNFNMIVMDMARGEVSDQPYDNMLTIQSQCQQYIDDVIANLYLGYTDAPEVLFDGLSYNTFNERFQDDVAGMTVNLQITVPQPINNCVTPFPSPIPPTPQCESELPVFAISTNNFPYTHDADTGTSWRWETELQQNTSIATWADQFMFGAVFGTYEILIEQTLRFQQPVGAEALPLRPILRRPFMPDLEPTCDSGNWPTVWTGEDIQYTAKWVVELSGSFTLITLANLPAAESPVTQLVGGTITIGYQAP